LAQANRVSAVDPSPIFPFGHGLSYAPPSWLSVEPLSSLDWPTDSSCKIPVTLRNDSEMATTEVVQVYLHDPVAEVSRPTQQLIGAARVELEPRSTRTVTLTLHADLTSYTGIDGQRQVDSGEVHLQVGASSADIKEVLRFELVGPRRQVGFDRIFEATAEIAAQGEA
jgi:beta-xylosidase